MARAANSPIFYGWWNVLASFVGLSLSYAMFTVFSFGVFVSPLQAEFDWGRGPMSLALTIANITVVVAGFDGEGLEPPGTDDVVERRAFDIPD